MSTELIHVYLSLTISVRERSPIKFEWIRKLICYGRPDILIALPRCAETLVDDFELPFQFQCPVAISLQRVTFLFASFVHEII